MPSKRNERAERAKLFQPFDSLKGFQDYLRAQERTVVPRKELLADACDVLDYKLQMIQPGMMIKVIYYDRGEYVAVEGMVARLDKEQTQTIQIVEKRIPIKQICHIEMDTEFLD